MIEVLRRLGLFVISSATLLAGCTGPRERVDFDHLTNALLTMIADNETKDAELQEAISRLGKATEPPSFWTTIADNQNYSAKHRRRCIQALLSRHGSTLETVSDLGMLLDKPKWLADEDISRVAVLAGHIPVEYTPQDTVFRIQLPSDLPERETAAVYVRVSGKMKPDEFSRVIRTDQSAPLVGGELILEVGFSD